MSRLELPLAFRTLRTTGEVVVHAELNLELKTDQGTRDPVPFQVDSGTEMTTMSAGEAKKLNLPIPKRPVPGLTFQGQEVRSGLLRARIPGMDATEYLFPCYFLGDPSGPAVRARNLLGLTGVITQSASRSTAHRRWLRPAGFWWWRRFSLARATAARSPEKSGDRSPTAVGDSPP